MAAPTLLEIMQGIETRLATISGLQVSDTFTGEITPPAAQVGMPRVTAYHSTMQRGRMQVAGQIYVFTSKADERVGQEALMGYANPTGTGSVVAAVYGDKTLGGKVEDIIIRTFEPLGADEVGDIPYFVGMFEWEVIALGA
jgi:hypothetical protein